jgi:4'-phosphopantetheinyl transferase
VLTITVYYTWVPNNLPRACENCWIRELPAGKQDTVRRMQSDKSRAASLLGLQLLKRAIEAQGVEDFDLGRVHFPRGGKPHCDLSIDFNISHSKALVICALSSSTKIGVDTERLREIRIEAFQRFLNPNERAWVGSDERRFLALWTQKEAVVKGRGVDGISSLRKVIIEDGRARLGHQTWTLQALDIHGDYVTHVAMEGDEARASVEVKRIATPI